MDTFTASGAGSPDVDGDYPETGVEGGKPYYFLDAATDFYIYWDGVNWNIETSIGALPGGRYYIHTTDTGSTPPLTGWVTTNGTGVNPAPTLSLAATGIAKRSHCC